MNDLDGGSLGKYRIIEEIGRGGMATVYKAYDRDLERTVALKVLPEYFRHDPNLRRRFKSEAIHAAQLEHPNIITIYDVGEDKALLYFAMQYVDGQTLGQVIHQKGPLPLASTADIIKQVASALDHAHAHGYVHRDVKPSNILITKSGEAILTDFGIVKAAEGTSLTRTGSMIGTPEYMSPEQVRGLGVDRRTDIYSLGVVCYEMLSGQVPFHGDTATVLHAHVYERPAPLHEVNPQVPLAVQRVLDTAMEKEPEKRYGNAGEMAVALERALASKTGAEAPTLVAVPPHVLLPKVAVSRFLSTPILAGIVLAVAALVGAIILFSPSGPIPVLWISPTPTATTRATATPRTAHSTATHPPPTSTPTRVPPTATPRPPTTTPQPAVPAPTPGLCFRGEVTRMEQIGWPLIQIHGVVVNENGQPLGLVMVRIDAGTSWYWAAQTWQNGGFGCDILAQPGTWFVSLPEIPGKPMVQVKIDHGERAIVTFTRTTCE